MNTIKTNITNIKNISHLSFDLPCENGLYLFVGENGCGKSTLLQCLSTLINRMSLYGLTEYDYNKSTSVSFETISSSFELRINDGKWVKSYKNSFRHFQGLYEGSLFYGTRFNDSKMVDALLMSGKILPEQIVDSDLYIKDKLSYILHGDYNHYKIKNWEVNLCMPSWDMEKCINIA